MSAAPRLSVVIPTYNRSEMLARAVASAAGHEVIIVDDCSTDDTQRVAADLVTANAATYLRMPRNGGPNPARNAGVRVATGDIVFFLDDDDVLLPGGPEIILEIATRHPRHVLFLHNCRWSDGSTTLPIADTDAELSYVEWLQGRFAGELKPAARRAVFEGEAFEDTGAGGEGLLWGRIIRDHGAVVGASPVVFYDVGHVERLTSRTGLLARAQANAGIAARWLELFGDDLHDAARPRWRGRVAAAVVWCGLGRQRTTARRLAGDARLTPSERVVMRAMAITPRIGLRAAVGGANAARRFRHAIAVARTALPQASAIPRRKGPR